MLHKSNLIFFFALVNIVFTVPVFAQQSDQKKLEEKRESLKEEINKIKTYIDKTQKKEANLSTQVENLNHKIVVREKLITVMDLEVDNISQVIAQKNEEITLFQTDLNVLKKDYAEMIYKTYKNKKSDNQLLFLLSSENFHQGYLRFQYLKQYAQFRKKQAKEIVVQSEKLKTLVDSLTLKKVYKEYLLEDRMSEQEKMEKEKEKQEELVIKYKKQKKEYIAQIKLKQEEEKQLTNQIENFIKEAIKKSVAKSTTSKTTTPTLKTTPATTTNKNEFVLAPEAKELAELFSSNKGNLPWPVEKGIVMVRFGKQPDPMDPKLFIESSGVRIATSENQKARAVFKGKVMAIQKNPQNGILSVLIQHGNYITVYANLKSVLVSKGEEVKIKQNIGTVQTDKVTGKTILKFQIWQNDVKMNPSLWIDGM
jgi:septal ring factor EnvC (AmiA/AmiB activator)